MGAVTRAAAAYIPRFNGQTAIPPLSHVRDIPWSWPFECWRPDTRAPAGMNVCPALILLRAASKTAVSSASANQTQSFAGSLMIEILDLQFSFLLRI
jgi:hypothetical protein